MHCSPHIHAPPMLRAPDNIPPYLVVWDCVGINTGVTHHPITLLQCHFYSSIGSTSFDWNGMEDFMTRKRRQRRNWKIPQVLIVCLQVSCFHILVPRYFFRLSGTHRHKHRQVHTRKHPKNKNGQPCSSSSLCRPWGHHSKQEQQRQRQCLVLQSG